MKHEKSLLAIGAVILGICITTFGMIAVFTVEEKQMPIREQSWGIVASESDPGAGASGVVNISIVPHASAPDYSSNRTGANSYAWGAPNAALSGDVPYDTEFDILIKARFNTTHAYNTSGTVWMMDWVRANLTSADLSIAANTSMAKTQIATTATFQWVYFYVNNSGNGYTMSHGQTFNVSYFKLEAFF